MDGAKMFLAANGGYCAWFNPMSVGPSSNISPPVPAPWAVSRDSLVGRALPERSHAYRTEFQRDRARLIHCTSFRRLDGKTQVFLNGSGDHYRTRLTHTMEVASSSRTVARALGLNEDLAECVALAHDLGHPPCGHRGEDELDRLLKGHGGFDHNAQSLRIVEVLEEKYPDFSGLNLTWEVREGIQKHARGYLHPLTGEQYPSPSLEAQITDMADEIAYSSHDLDDGLDAGLLDLESLSDIPLWQLACSQAEAEAPGFDVGRYRGFVIRCLVNMLVDDLVTQTARNLTTAGISTLDEVRRHPRRLAAFSPDTKSMLSGLRRHLFGSYYLHPLVSEANERAARLIAGLFGFLESNPECLGGKSRARISIDGLQRAIGDYISGMTDRYLARQHEDHIGVRVL